jgi:hypothetical protein
MIGTSPEEERRADIPAEVEGYQNLVFISAVSTVCQPQLVSIDAIERLTFIVPPGSGKVWKYDVYFRSGGSLQCEFDSYKQAIESWLKLSSMLDSILNRRQGSG